jgi:hypothetical protein
MVLEHEKDRLSDVREPKLVPHIDAFIVGEHASGKALCTLSVTIKNLGAPSVVDNYGLVIKIGDRISIGQFIVLPNQEFTVTLEMAGASASGPPLTLKQADFLYEKTTRPIATGSWERGWIMVIIPDFSREMMDVDGVIAEVSFVDVVGRRYSCDYAPTRENVGPLNYYPGAGGTHARPESQVKPETRATPKRSKKKG